jgi:hypothetical protein
VVVALRERALLAAAIGDLPAGARLREVLRVRPSLVVRDRVWAVEAGARDALLVVERAALALEDDVVFLGDAAQLQSIEH